jgi:predicted lipoprotein with Yx(FWY)xxD motif
MRGRAAKWVLPLVVVAALGLGAAMAATAAMHRTGGTVKIVARTQFGKVLVSSNGRTLYRYTPDRKGMSVCTGACVKFWPPLLVKAGTKPTAGAGANKRLLGTIKAAKGERQVTYAGFPLYFFAQDKRAGQATGEGYGGKWYVVNAKGGLVKHAMSTPPPAQTTTETTTTGGSAWG